MNRTQGKYVEPRVCIICTPNEIIAMNVAISRHINCFASEENQETNLLLMQFQARLIENLDALSIPMVNHPSLNINQEGRIPQ